MRRDFFAQVATFRGRGGLQLLPYQEQLLLQLFDLTLLAKNDEIELIELIIGETELRLQFIDTGFHA